MQGNIKTNAMKSLSLCTLLCLLLVSCGPKIYTAANFSTALARHKTVAILPCEGNHEVKA